MLISVFVCVCVCVCVCVFVCVFEGKARGSVCFCTPLCCVLCIMYVSALLVEIDLLTHLVVSFKLLTSTASLSR